MKMFFEVSGMVSCPPILFLAHKLPFQSGQPTPFLLLLHSIVGRQEILSRLGCSQVCSAVFGMIRPDS